MADKDEKYWSWIRWLAERLKSDGCTVVSEMYHECCLEHDIAYRTGHDPRELYYKGRVVPISRRETDARFRKCMQSRSKLGRFSPVSWFRWLGVRAFGGFTNNAFGEDKV